MRFAGVDRIHLTDYNNRFAIAWEHGEKITSVDFIDNGNIELWQSANGGSTYDLKGAHWRDDFTTGQGSLTSATRYDGHLNWCRCGRLVFCEFWFISLVSMGVYTASDFFFTNMPSAYFTLMSSCKADGFTGAVLCTVNNTGNGDAGFRIVPRETGFGDNTVFMGCVAYLTDAQ